MAVVVVQVGAVRVGDLELHPSQRFPGLFIQLLYHDTALLLIVKTEGLRLAHLDFDALGRGIENIALQRLNLPGGDGHAGFQALDHNAAILVGDILAVGAANHLTIGFRYQESYPFQRVSGSSDIFLNDQSASLFIPKGQLLDFPGFNQNVLGRTVKDISLHGFDLSGNHGRTRLNACQDNLAGFIGVVEAVIRPDSGPGSVHHPEGHAGKRFVLGALHELPNNQRGRGSIVKIDGLRIVGVDYHSLRPGVGVDPVTGDRLQLRYNDSPGYAGEDDLPVAVREIDAVRGNLPVLVIHDLPVGVLDPELHALQGRVVQRTQFVDNQVAERLVEHFQGIRLVVLDFHGMGCIIQQITGLGLNLPHNIAAGFQIRQGNEAALVRPVFTVGVAHDGAIRPGDLENDIRKRLLCGGVHLLHQQTTQRHVGKAQNLGVRLADHHRLRRGVQQVAVNRFHFRNHIGVGIQLAEIDLSVFICGV